MTSAWTIVDSRCAITNTVRSGEQSIDGFLDESFRLGVERGRRFVENENRRIDEQRARDGESLALAAGQPRAAFAEDGVVAVRQARR